MKNFFTTTVLTLLITLSLSAQSTRKAEAPARITPTNFHIEQFDPAIEPAPGLPRAERSLPRRLSYQPLTTIPGPALAEGIRVTARDANGSPLYLEGRSPHSGASVPIREQAQAFLRHAAPLLGIQDPDAEFALAQPHTDALGMVHIRARQVYRGLPVYGSELILHAPAGTIERLNGRTYPTPQLVAVVPGLAAEQARQLALADLARRTVVRELTAAERAWAHDPDTAPELTIYHHELDLRAERLAWHLRLVPNVAEHWEYFIDARTGEILNQIRVTCSLVPTDLPTSLLPPGPQTAVATDLNNVNRTLNVYEENGTYYLVDASRPMFDASQATLSGVIKTYDAAGSNPEADDFSASLVASNNNQWTDRVAVSAHYNAGIAYEYFRTRFQRNSINGQGGDVQSIINIKDQGGNDVGNAFWNGIAMFYGNGDNCFGPLAASLDVAGHEMSHGVIQNTANLTYQGQSGAANESFADVFGYLIDPSNFLLGDGVTGTNCFPTGALRDLADPNNGGSSLNDLGWQPAHMNEFEELALDVDNGGVHVNSGILNRAFYLFTTNAAVGNAKAERVYYRALSEYLTASSQFIDVRLAVIRAAQDLYGNNSAEAAAAANAFAAVGIGEGSGTDTQENLGENPGDDFILATDQPGNGNYLYDFNQITQLSSSGIVSRPSVTDDGSVIVFVASDNTLRALIQNQQSGLYEEFSVENEPQQIWRNIAISKDGNRIAMLTTDYDNRLFVYDYPTQTSQTFTLGNPTTAEGGGFTDDVAYADVLEWDYSGEYLLYDALTELGPTAEGTDFWDINLIQVWDDTGQAFANGFTIKVFSALPPNSSVGNPAFAKNSPYVIAFDFAGEAETFTDISILGANLETGDVGGIHYNGDQLGWPSFSRTDEFLLFNAGTQENPTLDVIPLAADKINANGTPTTLLTNARNGVWFGNGDRPLTVATREAVATAFDLRVFPNPVADRCELRFTATQAGTGELYLYDAVGRPVATQRLSVRPDRNHVAIDLSGLPGGWYTARLRLPEGTTGTKLLKR